MTKRDKETRLCWSPNLLRFLRMQRGWSLLDTCVHWNELYPEPNIKLSKNQVLCYELGQSIPRADRVSMLCDVFEIEVDFLFTRSAEEEREKMGDWADKVYESIRKRGPTVLPKISAHEVRNS